VEVQKKISNAVDPKSVGFDILAESFQVDETTLRKWQSLVDIMAELTDVPTGLIMRVNWPEIEVLISSDSEGNPYNQGDSERLPDSGLYCETVIKSKEKLKIPDATVDPDWRDNPDIALNMISYLGYPIFLPYGQVFGTLCILDNKPNDHPEKTDKLMLQLKDLVESHLALIWRNRELEDRVKEIETLRGILPICSYCKNIRNDKGYWEAVDKYMVEHKGFEFTHSICPNCMKKHFGEVADGMDLETFPKTTK